MLELLTLLDIDFVVSWHSLMNKTYLPDSAFFSENNYKSYTSISSSNSSFAFHILSQNLKSFPALTFSFPPYLQTLSPNSTFLTATRVSKKELCFNLFVAHWIWTSIYHFVTVWFHYELKCYITYLSPIPFAAFYPLNEHFNVEKTALTKSNADCVYLKLCRL